MNTFEYSSPNNLIFTNVDELNFSVHNQTNDELVFTYQYFPELKYAIQVWRKYIDSDQMREIYLYIGQYTYANKQKIYGTISDLMTFDGSFEPMNEWFIKEYMPISVKNGFAFSAVVKPKDFFATLALDDLNSIAIYHHEEFETMEEGINWLEENLRNYTFEKKQTPNV